MRDAHARVRLKHWSGEQPAVCIKGSNVGERRNKSDVEEFWFGQPEGGGVGNTGTEADFREKRRNCGFCVLIQDDS